MAKRVNRVKRFMFLVSNPNGIEGTDAETIGASGVSCVPRMLRSTE
jgi:hypothetical protein